MRERIKNGSNLLESHVFRFDFLNDSFDKLPEDLRDVIKDPEKRKSLVVYINPPYVEASNAQTTHGTPGDNRVGVSASSIRTKYLMEMGRAVNELFAQFLIRIANEIPGCIIGQFSKLKHLQGPNFKTFRQAFRGTLEKCFIVPADTFDNVKGQFPIGFFVWYMRDAASAAGSFGVSEKSAVSPKLRDSQPPSSESNSSSGVFTETIADVYDRQGVFIGTKSIFSPDGQCVLTDWIRQFYDTTGAHLAYCRYLGSDFQHNNGVFITLSPSVSDLKQVKGNWITPKNVMDFAVYFAVRLSIDADWLNDRDQFLYPNYGWKNDAEFLADCLLFALFSGQNRVSSADGVNHWIPFTEAEVDAKSCFKSHFMSDLINGRAVTAASSMPPCQGELFAKPSSLNPVNPVKNDSASLRLCVKDNLSSAARAVLEAGRELWRYYHAQPNANPNASYYDIRLHFQGVKKTASGREQMNATSSDETYNAHLASLRVAHKTLAAQIVPKAYEYGFLQQ